MTMFPMTAKEKADISARMKASAERRRCPACGKANALVAQKRARPGIPTELAKMVCRYCAPGGKAGNQ